MASSILETVDRLKDELDALRPLPSAVVARVEQKLRIESDYHSNAVEGNSLTLGETRSLILHGLTARGKPMRDHLDIQGHDDAVKAIERAVKEHRADRSLHPQSPPSIAEGTVRDRCHDLWRPPYDATHRPRRLQGNPEQREDLDRGDVLLHAAGAGEAGDDRSPRPVSSGRKPPASIRSSSQLRSITWFVRMHPFDDGNGECGSKGYRCRFAKCPGVGRIVEEQH